MNFIRVFAHLFLFLALFACNTAERKEVGQSQSNESSIKSATFIYNVSRIVLTENTTSARFIPVEKFPGSFFRVLPTLPAGLFLNTSTGEISGTPTEVLTETEFLVEVDTLDGTEYAFLNITVNPEAPKSIDYPFTTLQFNKGQIGSFTPVLTGGVVANFTVNPPLPSWLLLNNTTGALETDPALALATLDTVMVPTSSFHTITASNATGSTVTTVLVSVNDAPPVGLSYDITTQDYVIDGTPAPVFSNMSPQPLTPPLPASVSYNIVPQLPNGLVLNPDGVISGAPEEKPGTNVYTITASNSQGSTSTVITLNITEPSTSLLYNPSTFTVEQNVPISPIQVNTYEGGQGERYRCFIDANTDGIEDLAEVGTCPAWVTVDPTTGLVSGTPDTIGVVLLTILVENPDNSSPLVGTPTPPVDVLTFNVIEDRPNDPNDLGYISPYNITENQSTNITPRNPGGFPSFMELIGSKAQETNGGANTFSTLSGVATFTNPLPAGVGAGDAIHFDSNNDGKMDQAIFIRTQISSTLFEVYTSATDGDNEVGAGNQLVISGGNTATFTSDVANAIDNTNFIIYDSTGDGLFDTVADITVENTANRVFTVQALGGGPVPNIPLGTERWIIHFNSTVANVGPIDDWIIYNGLPSGMTFFDGVIAGTPNLNNNGATACTQSTGGTFPLQIDGRNILDNSGGTKQLTDITAGVATFSADVSSAVAVNDILYYDSDGDSTNDSFARVTVVNSQTSYNVQKLDGSLVPNTGAINDLDWNFSSISGSQNITLDLRAVPPARLGYTTGRSGAIFKSGVFELTDGSPIPVDQLIKPNDFTGGTPEIFTVSPRLPRGLTLDPCTGIISGTPQEILPIRNYTITATNSAGSFSETIAISTNNLIAPTDLVYNDANNTCADDQPNDNDLVFTLLNSAIQTEAPCYFGSDASFSINPALPAGLVLNTLTGEISGVPIITDDNVNTFVVTATNRLGSLSTTITITINNRPILSDAVDFFFGGSPVSALVLTEGDVINAGDIAVQVTSNATNQSGVPTIFSASITTVPHVASGTPAAIEAFLSLVSGNDPKDALNNATQTSNLVLNTSNGEFTTFVETNGVSQGLTPTTPREIAPNPSFIVVDFDNVNIPGGIDGTGNNLAINTVPTPSEATFASALSTDVGIGDLLFYDSDGDGIEDARARIVSIPTPTTVFGIENLDGTKVTTTITAEQNWNINQNATINGTANALTVDILPTITTATVITPLPTTVGVDDILFYDSDGDNAPETRVVITRAISTSQFEVANLDGSKVTAAVVGDVDWTINSGKVFSLLVNERPLDFDYVGGANSLNVLTGKTSGSALHFDSDNDGEMDSVSFITSRVNDTTFNVAGARGTAVPDLSTAEDTWYISGNFIQGSTNDMVTGAGFIAFNEDVSLIAGDLVRYDSDSDGLLDETARITTVINARTYNAQDASTGGALTGIGIAQNWAAKGGQNGRGITLTIVGTNVAVFSSPMDIKIGDTIRYDANADDAIDEVAIITGKITDSSFNITSTAGGAATNVVSDNDWIVSGAYFEEANQLTIAANTATFNNNLDVIPTVGSIIVYDADGGNTGLDNAAIITQVNSALSFDVTALDGTNAIDTTGNVAAFGEWEITQGKDTGFSKTLTISNGVATFSQNITPPETFDGADLASGSANHVGGAVALTNAGVVQNFCNATLISTTRIPSGNASLTDSDNDGFHDGDLLNIPDSGISLNAATCNIEYSGNVCASDSRTGVDGSGDPFFAGNATLEYRIQAFNSGSPLPTGVTRNVTINYFDRPNFLYEPDPNFSESKYTPKNGYVAALNEFEMSKNLTLAGNVVNSSGAPTTANRCHEGTFTLDLLADLPSNIFAFNSTDGSIRISNSGIFIRSDFTLTSTESISGQNFSQSENITVQANHVQAIGVTETNREFKALKFDFNSDGSEDILLTLQACFDGDGDGTSDDAANCAAGGANAPTILYTQDTGTRGLFNNHENTFSTFETNNAFAIAPMIYDTGLSGVIFVREDPATPGEILVQSQSITSPFTNASTLDATTEPAGRLAASVGIVPNKDGVSDGFGVVIDNGDRAANGRPIVIDQYAVDTSFNIAAAATATITLQNKANGGIELGNFGGTDGSIQIVTHNDTDGDGNMDIVIGYTDRTTSTEQSFVCVIKNNGTDFADACNPREPVPNNGKIKDIKFANISNDILDEMFVLSSDGTNNEITVFENRNATDVAGSYQSIDQVVLKTLPAHLQGFPSFDIADANNDGFLDLIVADVNGDIDRDTIANDGVVSGLTIYRNTQNTANLFVEDTTNTDEFPTLLHYSNSAGNTNEIEVIRSGLDILIFHCQIDNDDTTNASGPSANLRTTSGLPLTPTTQSSCGIVGRF